jgi:UDP-N-acetylmuramate--alanine ligase
MSDQDSLFRRLPPGARVHIIGIGGAAMSALATVLLERGFRVSGSDLTPSMVTEHLAQDGVQVFYGHHPANIGDAALVLYSSAVPATNPERQEAARRGIPAIRRAEAQGMLTLERTTVAIAGTAGKTTTTAMVAALLTKAGLDPSFLIGGESIDLGASARWGRGPYLVIEADEFDRTFLSLHPHIAIVLNAEPDHLDYYRTPAAFVDAFAAFIQRTAPEGAVILCTDDRTVRDRLASLDLPARCITYSLAEPDGGADPTHWWARGVRYGTQYTTFGAMQGDRLRLVVRLNLPGSHVVRNTLAALAAVDALGVDLARAREALERFRGVHRRFEFKGQVEGIRVYDDYAHHPMKIRATLAAARQRFPEQRIWAVFQPHLYARTSSLLEQFLDSFSDADRVTIVDTYSPAGREGEERTVTSEELARRLRHPAAEYGGDLAAAAAHVAREARAGDVIFTMGAGTITELGPQIVRLLQERAAARRDEPWS